MVFPSYDDGDIRKNLMVFSSIYCSPAREIPSRGCSPTVYPVVPAQYILMDSFVGFFYTAFGGVIQCHSIISSFELFTLGTVL